MSNIISVYQNLKQYIQNKSQGINVTLAFFGDGVFYSDSILSTSHNKTDISDALLKISEINENDGCNVLMITDGIWNTGADPLFMNIPGIKSLHIIGIGDSCIYPDAMISELRIPPRCRPKENITGEIQLFVNSIKGKTLTIRITEANKVVFEKNIHVDTEKFSTNLIFEFPVDEKGIHTYKAEIFSEIDEKNKANNSRWFSILAEDMRYEIFVLYDYISPDMNAIFSSLSSYDDYKFTLKQITEWKFEFDKIPSACLVFHPGKHTLDLLNILKNKNIPVWFFNPDLNGLSKNFQIQQLLSNKLNDSEPLFNPSFDYFNLTQEQKEFFSQYPAISSPAGIYSSKTGMALFYQKINSNTTQLPLWIFDKDNSGMRYIWTLGDGIWKWKFYEYRKRNQNNYFNELIYKSIQFLTADYTKKRLNLNYSKLVKEFEDVNFSATYLNENLEPDINGEMKLTLKDTTGKAFDYLMSPSNMNYKLNVGKLPPGKYFVTIQTERNKQIYKDEGSFVVLPINIELADLRARFADLRLLAEKNNGSFHLYKYYHRAVDEWLSEKYQKQVVESEEVREPPVHIKWFFFIILFFFAAEWVILKYFGYI